MANQQTDQVFDAKPVPVKVHQSWKQLLRKQQSITVR